MVDKKSELVSLKTKIKNKKTKVDTFISNLEADIKTLNATDSVYLKKEVVGKSNSDQPWGNSMFGVPSNSLNAILAYLYEWRNREPAKIQELSDLIDSVQDQIDAIDAAASSSSGS